MTAPTVTAPIEGKCEHCHQARPLFFYEPQHNGHISPGEFGCRWCTRDGQPQLCVRCFEREAELEANDPHLQREAEKFDAIFGAGRELVRQTFEGGAQ